MRTLWSRLAGLFGRRHRDGDLDEEVNFHLEMLVQQHMRAGLTADAARAAARRSFGGTARARSCERPPSPSPPC
jgi:hypothetical protein